MISIEKRKGGGVLKLFMLERGRLLGYGRSVMVVAAQSEEDARKTAVENDSARYSDLWLKKENEYIEILTDVTYQETNGAKCKEIGIAGADIAPGIVLSLESFLPPTEILAQNKE